MSSRGVESSQVESRTHAVDCARRLARRVRGVTGRAAFLRVGDARGAPRGAMAALFSRLDANGDGAVTGGEWSNVEAAAAAVGAAAYIEAAAITEAAQVRVRAVRGVDRQ